PTTVNNPQLGRSASVNLTSVLSPTVTNEFIFSFSKLKLDNIHADESKISLAGLGINNYQGFYGPLSPFAPIQIYSWDRASGNLRPPSDHKTTSANTSSRTSPNSSTRAWTTHGVR